MTTPKKPKKLKRKSKDHQSREYKKFLSYKSAQSEAKKILNTIKSRESDLIAILYPNGLRPSESIWAVKLDGVTLGTTRSLDKVEYTYSYHYSYKFPINHTLTKPLTEILK